MISIPILVGPRASGKTSIGRELSNWLNFPFVDSDTEFEKKFGSIGAFVDKYDWPAFRREESQVISEICSKYKGSKLVLATGGGVVAHDQGEEYRKSNVEALHDLGVIFYLLPNLDLRKSARILADRIDSRTSSKASRPSLTGSKDTYIDMLDTLYRRHNIYMEARDVLVLTQNAPFADAVQSILPHLRR